MRKRTDAEILALALEFEIQQMESLYGDRTLSLFELMVESLEGDEYPNWVKNKGWDFKDASITEEEFCEMICEPVENLLRERNHNRWLRRERICERLLEAKKNE
jgi:3-methyladenine DNA glycosylase AlkD